MEIKKLKEENSALIDECQKQKQNRNSNLDAESKEIQSQKLDPKAIESVIDKLISSEQMRNLIREKLNPENIND